MFENDRRARGSSMILVALLMVPLLGFAALAIDVGMIYTARAQCQNAADAGALAGAGYMLTLNNLNAGATSNIKAKAVEFANYNQVLSKPVSILPSDVTVDFNLKRCTVCVPRTAARGNAVQTLFARVLLRNSVDVSACATAEIANARASNCLKPWALPDAFVDGNGNGRYDAGEYYQQGVTSFGTNYRQNGFDVGIQIIVKQADPSAAIAPGQFFPIDLPIDGVDTGAARYQNNIATCEPAPVKIGDTLYTENGNMVGPTRTGVRELILQDSNAFWDSASGQVGGSDYGPSGSPRIIRVPFFDPSQPPVSGKTTITVTNIASLFLEGINGGVVTARIMLAAGQEPGGNPGALQFVRLVQ